MNIQKICSFFFLLVVLGFYAYLNLCPLLPPSAAAGPVLPSVFKQ